MEQTHTKNSQHSIKAKFWFLLTWCIIPQLESRSSSGNVSWWKPRCVYLVILFFEFGKLAGTRHFILFATTSRTQTHATWKAIHSLTPKQPDKRVVPDVVPSVWKDSCKKHVYLESCSVLAPVCIVQRESSLPQIRHEINQNYLWTWALLA